MQVGANISGLETIAVSAAGIVTLPCVLGGTPAARGCTQQGILAYSGRWFGNPHGRVVPPNPCAGALISELG
jgi:hypothetical protein